MLNQHPLRLSAAIVALSLAFLARSGVTQANLYVDSVAGSNLNAGTDPDFPKQTLVREVAGVPGVLVGLPDPPPWNVHLRAGSVFQEDPFILPKRVNLRYWDPDSTDLFVDITPWNNPNPGLPLITLPADGVIASKWGIHGATTGSTASSVGLTEAGIRAA